MREAGRGKLSFCEMKYQMIMARALPIEVTQGTLEGDIKPRTLQLQRPRAFQGTGESRKIQLHLTLINPPFFHWFPDIAEHLAQHAEEHQQGAHRGLAIMMVILALNLLGDGLRDALDPRMKR